MVRGRGGVVKVVDNVLWSSSVDFDEYIVVTVFGGVVGAWLEGEGVWLRW